MADRDDLPIVVREATSDADLEAWRRVRLAVLPGERALPVADMLAMQTPETAYLLAERGGRVVGSGLGDRSSFDYAGLHPRVLPDERRRGVGTAILRDLERRAIALGFTEAGTSVDDAGSVAFAERFGFREVDRQVEQVRTVADEPMPEPIAGVDVVSVSERPELWSAAYEPFALQAFADMATHAPIVVTREQWERDWLVWPEGMFLALAGGEIVGCGGLEYDADEPSRAEHALTAVARGWRRRGIATMLKRRALAFGTANGVTEVYTWTQLHNADMRALNERLGYETRQTSVTVRAPLPLPVPPDRDPAPG